MNTESTTTVIPNILKEDEVEDDDWETLAEHVEEKLSLSIKEETNINSCSSQKSYSSPSTIKRRGRGSFLYGKSVMYSDQLEAGVAEDFKPDTNQCASEHRHEDRASGVPGVKHVLVLYDFSPSTRTIDLERIFEEYKDHGYAIRWVNDTVVLAVFRSPSMASDAKNQVPSELKVRMLKEDDELLAEIDNRDLEIPHPRPRTSASTAQRMIAHGMGLKPFSENGISEHKRQEEARRNRIVARQNLREDAWGAN